MMVFLKLSQWSIISGPCPATILHPPHRQLMYRRSICRGRCAPSYAPTAYSYALATDPAGLPAIRHVLPRLQSAMSYRACNPLYPTSYRARVPRGVLYIYS
ncbi:hypothetical protein BT67DRAFT_101933 [Trichocladium antarcticum]|uniref:Uncharacterized protein n=1 Tax=Trichocladium antarcticum TaxID=1450529 RepID=A0AAN6UQP4_9PEZI|nr:hypothetical protein BT67DRAFT_101933 [Trichocladium antarcticum]